MNKKRSQIPTNVLSKEKLKELLKFKKTREEKDKKIQQRLSTGSDDNEKKRKLEITEVSETNIEKKKQKSSNQVKNFVDL
jgi:hypothetical protein